MRRIRVLMLLLAVGSFISCQGRSPSGPSETGPAAIPTTNPTTNPPANRPANPTTTAGREVDGKLCYLYQSNANLIRLNFTLTGANVTGTLEYRLEGKEVRQGELRGQVQGDILYGQYTFQSGGKTSIREVAFKLTAQEAREGHGETWELGGRTLFKNRQGLKFDAAVILKAVSCN